MKTLNVVSVFIKNAFKLISDQLAIIVNFLMLCGLRELRLRKSICIRNRSGGGYIYRLVAYQMDLLCLKRQFEFRTEL